MSSFLPIISTTLIPLTSLTSFTIYLSTHQSSPFRKLLKNGKIALPTHNGEGLDGYSELEGEEKDAFDIDEPLVCEDGTPVEPEKFWASMRWRKWGVLLSMIPPIACNIALLVFTILSDIRGDQRTRAILLPTLLLPAQMVTVVLTIWHLRQNETYAHWATTIHLSVDIFVQFLILSTLALLPSTPMPSSQGLLATFARVDLFMLPRSPVDILKPLLPILYLLPLALVLSIQRGPPLYLPLDAIYPAKILEAVPEGTESLDPSKPNVSPEVQATVPEWLLFGYATGVVRKGYVSDSLDVWDLPILPKGLRALYQYKRMKKVYGKRKGRLGRWEGYNLLWKVAKVNKAMLWAQTLIATATAFGYYLPHYFLLKFVEYLENDPTRSTPAWGWLLCFGLFMANAIMFIATGVTWSISSTYLQGKIKLQLNTMLFSKTLRKKDIAAAGEDKGDSQEKNKDKDKDKDSEDKDEEDEGVSSKTQIMMSIESRISYFIIVVRAQENLMKTRDQRTALMNEILQGIRMLKFMAWERSFETRVQGLRKTELSWQARNYQIEVAFSCIWALTPVIVTVVSFLDALSPQVSPLHPLLCSPSYDMPSALYRKRSSRHFKYLSLAEVAPIEENDGDSDIILTSATYTWPRDDSAIQGPKSTATTPKSAFTLADLTLRFPKGKLSLICGRLGSGKSLLLAGLLGEADLLAGQVICPRSAPNAMSHEEKITDWIIPNMVGYVPQQAWLQNASIKDNIIFSSRFDPERYQRVIEACSLVTDLEILEDGDQTEIGEKGLNLSGGQKARAEPVFCFLTMGDVKFSGTRDDFVASGLMDKLDEEEKPKEEQIDNIKPAHKSLVSLSAEASEPNSETSSIAPDETTLANSEIKKTPRKLIEDEKRERGRIAWVVWKTYFNALGGPVWWFFFILALAMAMFVPVAEKGWLEYWTGSNLTAKGAHTTQYYVIGYSAIAIAGVFAGQMQYAVVYIGSLQASRKLHNAMLESVLFSTLRFHDTTSRGRLLNRFGKDIEGLDSSTADNLVRSFAYALNVIVTFVSITYVGGLPFIFAGGVILIVYYQAGSIYGQTSRDMRRLDSVTRSPLYSLFGETVSGVAVLRAFGASTISLKQMMRLADTNLLAFAWSWTVNRWLSARFNLLSALMVGFTAVAVLIAPGVDAAMAGFALSFAGTICHDLLFVVRRFVQLEQSMVAIERLKEFTELKREAPEVVEPRPPASWPEHGSISVEKLIIRYAPDLPDVLHSISFKVAPKEKIGIVGATGCGKSTLALSFFRFVEATEGKIIIDGIDISKIGLTDLRSRVTIIPQDPTILSGTLRSTLDVFDEYDDAEIYAALRRVHLIKDSDIGATAEDDEARNKNVFTDLNNPVSEGGDNFSSGEKQLICMARAILKRNKLLFMDEATASIDFSKTIREEFSESTILTIAHRIHTIIDFDKVLVMDQGRIAEFASPAELLRDHRSKFYSLCKATGRTEFKNLKALAMEAERKRR
ncbi:hypothetical protein IAT40_003041 [Kwoniella sp. CBS 6097]